MAQNANQLRPEAKADPAPSHRAPNAGPAPAQTHGDYLVSNGWRPLGDPSWPACMWLDPLKPVTEETLDLPIFAWNQDGTRYARVSVLDGKTNSEIRENASRKLVRPAGEPVSTAAAMFAQYERDVAASRGPQALGRKRLLEMAAIKEANCWPDFERAGLLPRWETVRESAEAAVRDEQELRGGKRRVA